MTLDRIFELTKLKERPAGFVAEDTPFKQEVDVKSDFTFSEVDNKESAEMKELLDRIPKEYFVKFKIDPER